MRFEDKKRTIGIGIIVWLLFFGWWFNDYLRLNWHFKFFSLDSWRFLINEYRAGWHLSFKSDWIFLFSFIIAGPIYLGLWYWANKIHWRRSARRVVKTCKKPLQKLKTGNMNVPVVHEYQPKAAVQRPAKLTPGMSAMRSSGAMPSVTKAPFEMTSPQPSWMTPNETPTAQEKSFPAEQPFYHTDPAFNDIAETPLSEVQLPQIEAVNEDISALMTEKGFHVFSDVPFGENKVSWLGVSQNKLLVGVYDDETGDWLADEEAFNDEDPLWFSETDHRVSPVFTLKQMQKQLTEAVADLGLQVQPVLIERRGNLINAEDMMKTWNDLGVIVCRTDVGGPVELATFAEACGEDQQAPSAEVLERIHSVFNLGEKVNG